MHLISVAPVLYNPSQELVLKGVDLTIGNEDTDLRGAETVKSANTGCTMESKSYNLTVVSE
jgi:hypothetical protein